MNISSSKHRNWKYSFDECIKTILILGMFMVCIYDLMFWGLAVLCVKVLPMYWHILQLPSSVQWASRRMLPPHMSHTMAVIVVVQSMLLPSGHGHWLRGVWRKQDESRLPSLCIDFLDEAQRMSEYFNPFQSNFSANRILPSSCLFWAGKRLVDYL
jgi:hypothetical protein